MKTNPKESQSISICRASYFIKVLIKHASTGRYLAAKNEGYSYENASDPKDHLKVYCSSNINDDCWWLIRPPHRNYHDIVQSKPIYSGYILSLFHLSTKRNLHTHNHNAKIEKHFEVTTFGSANKGNSDDNWVIESNESDDPEILAGDAIILRHANHSYWLSSVENYYDEKGNEQIVTSSLDQNEYITWTFDRFETYSEPLPIHSYATIKYEIGNQTSVEKNFDSPAELASWSQQQKSIFNKFLKNVPANFGVGKLLQDINSTFDGLAKSAKEAASQRNDHSTYYSKLKEVETHVRNIQGKSLLTSDDPRFIYCDSIKSQDETGAAHCLLQFLNRLELQAIPPSILAAVLRTSMFELQIGDAIPFQIDRIKELHSEITNYKTELEKQASASTKSVQILVSESEKQLHQQYSKSEDQIKSAENELSRIKKAYDEEMSLRSAVRYWNNESNASAKLAKVWGKVSAHLAAWVLLGIVMALYYVLGADGTQPPWWKIGTLAAITTIGLWVVRICVKIFLSHLHRISDFRERRTMVQVYIALLRKHEGAITDQERVLALQAIFRPGSTGIVRDDTHVHPLIEAIASKLGKS